MKSLQRYFKDLFDALNGFADSTSLDIKYYKGAADIIKSFALTDNLEDLAILPGAERGAVHEYSPIIQPLKSFPN